MKCGQKIEYDFVGDVVRRQAFVGLTFPGASINSPNLILSG